LAKERAVSLYRNALALVPDNDGARRRELQLRLAVSLQQVYHLRDAQRLRRDADAGERAGA